MLIIMLITSCQLFGTKKMVAMDTMVAMATVVAMVALCSAITAIYNTLIMTST